MTSIMACCWTGATDWQLAVDQRAMATVESVFATNTDIGRDEREQFAGFDAASSSRIDYVLVIRRHAPDLVAAVLSGAEPLNDA